MVYNYVNFINIFYDKELLALNYSKLNAFILIHCGLYIIYITMCFNTFEAYFSYISHILTLFIIYYLLFIIYYLLFIIYYLLFIIYYLLFIIYYILSIIYYLLINALFILFIIL